MSETATVSRSGQTNRTFRRLIVGAGISGVGGAYHMTQQCPDKSFVVLEALDNYGGTWWTHRYPGIRSDSDLHTFGYRFKPWTSAPIATAAEILSYMGEVIAENHLAPHIRYRHKIATARWSSNENRWTIEATRTDTNERVRYHREFPVDVPGLLSPAPGLHAGMGRDAGRSRARSPIPQTGRRTSTTRTSTSSSSVRGPPRRL